MAEVCRLKNDPKTQNVPVVMCSSKAEESLLGHEAADAYIIKPFQPKDLLVTIKQLLQV